MAQEGSPVSIAKACQLAGLPRRTFYYQSKRRARRINDALAARIKRVIDTLPYAGYRTTGGSFFLFSNQLLMCLSSITGISRRLLPLPVPMNWGWVYNLWFDEFALHTARNAQF